MKHIYVAAGIMFNSDQHVLLAQRPQGSDMELLWEFAGGKLEPGESPEEAIVRELHEELGVNSVAGKVVFEETFQYPDKIVTLYFVTIDSFYPEPMALEHAEIKWVKLDQLRDYDFPPADDEFITFLQSGMI